VHLGTKVSTVQFIFIRATVLGCAVLAVWACDNPETEPSPTTGSTIPKNVEIEFREAYQLYFDLPPLVPSVKHVVIGRHGWILLKSELEYLIDNKPKVLVGDAGEDSLPRGAVDPRTAILYFNRELKKMGITLIVVPVPVRPLVYPGSVLDSPRLTDLPRPPYLFRKQKEFFDHLESNDCEAVDLTPTFIDHRASARGPVFIPTESHWTGFGMYVAGQEIAEAVKRMDWYSTWGKTSIQQEWLTIDHMGDLSKRISDGLEGTDVTPTGLHDVALGPVQMDVRKVTSSVENRSVPIERRNPESPVVIVGDSYTDFGSAQGFGIGHQLAFELGFPLDVLTTKGGGANAARMNLIRAAQSDPNYLTGKKCVIWCFASRDMVGEQWFVTPFRR
jgi:alginate O-acetyltransferase complex protein AlgJ